MSDKRQVFRDAFLKAVFSLLGYVAACDQPLNRQEVQRLKVQMEKMRLSETEQRNALQLFKSGTQAGFNVHQALQEFRQATTPKLIQILIVHLITMARSDGGLVEKELHAIQWLARELGYKSIVLFQLLKMIYTQDQLLQRKVLPNGEPPPLYQPGHKVDKPHTANTQNAASASSLQNLELNNAYRILGVHSGMTEAEIRRAYKRLASQFHPDKLASQGLAQDQLRAATEEFKKILAAYKFLKQHRFLYSPGSP